MDVDGVENAIENNDDEVVNGHGKEVEEEEEEEGEQEGEYEVENILDHKMQSVSPPGCAVVDELTRGRCSLRYVS